MMKLLKIRSATRLALTIGIVCASLIWLACGLQIVPNPFRPIVESRVRMTKSISATVTTFVENQRFLDLQKTLDRMLATNDEIVSVGVERNGLYVADSGNHTAVWKPLKDGKSTENQLHVQIRSNGQNWGDLELVFRPLNMYGIRGLLFFPLPLVGFMTCTLSLITWYVLSKTLRYMNPSQVVPGRVRSAFDTLAEGLMLVDKSGEIAHANRAFCEMVNHDIEEVIGQNANDVEWTLGKPNGNSIIEYPWTEALENAKPVTGKIIEIIRDGRLQKFIVNSTPIIGENGGCRGVLTSFDNVTDLEAKKEELSRIVDSLRKSQNEIEEQNEQLNFLANYDPMTKCMNRRAFWVQYEKMWKNVEPDQLSIIMVDVDHFKSINDNYGHSIGDEVLIGVGQLLQEVVGDRGAVCRYGGEEFAVLFPNMDFDSATEIAEAVCIAFRNRQISNLSITVSIGVSNRSLNAMDPQHMLDQADQCLYGAKRNGRDQVVRFDECPEELDSPDEQSSSSGISEPNIEYSAVTGLLSALSFKHADTCHHSLRVADLAVAVGRGLLSRRELYKLEVSALLHDIGKIGVPDSILNKPGPLTKEEWKVMSKHDDIGVEIVQSAFACSEIAEIVSAHHHCFSVRNALNQQLVFRDQIPLGARILTVCDAFDAMVSDRVYRKGMSHSEAFKELRRCAPDQFDPVIVEKLIEHVETQGYAQDNGVHFVNTSKSAVAIGKHIELICNAIQSENVALLQKTVEELKTDAINNQIEPIADAALRLNDALGEKDSDVLNVLELADEVMDLCRSTRTAFVDTANATMGDLP